MCLHEEAETAFGFRRSVTFQPNQSWWQWEQWEDKHTCEIYHLLAWQWTVGHFSHFCQPLSELSLLFTFSIKKSDNHFLQKYRSGRLWLILKSQRHASNSMCKLWECVVVCTWTKKKEGNESSRKQLSSQRLKVILLEQCHTCHNKNWAKIPIIPAYFLLQLPWESPCLLCICTGAPTQNTHQPQTWVTHLLNMSHFCVTIWMGLRPWLVNSSEAVCSSADSGLTFQAWQFYSVCWTAGGGEELKLLMVSDYFFLFQFCFNDLFFLIKKNVTVLDWATQQEAHFRHIKATLTFLASHTAKILNTNSFCLPPKSHPPSSCSPTFLWAPSSTELGRIGVEAALLFS